MQAKWIEKGNEKFLQIEMDPSLDAKHFEKSGRDGMYGRIQINDPNSTKMITVQVITY